MTVTAFHKLDGWLVGVDGVYRCSYNVLGSLASPAITQISSGTTQMFWDLENVQEPLGC